MKTVYLDENTRALFWDQVNRDPREYHFFIFDWTYGREKTKITLALNEKIEGLMLEFSNYVVQVRGTLEAVDSLIDGLTLDSFELQAPPECEDLILRRFTPKYKTYMDMMSLSKVNDQNPVFVMTEELGPADAEEIAEIMRQCDPVWWEEVTGERIREGMSSGAYWLGIRQDDVLRSIGACRPLSFGGNISTAATRQQYRNRGYATQIVTALARKILTVAPFALIHVLKDNAPAVRAYSKVGFETYRTYFSIRT